MQRAVKKFLQLFAFLLVWDLPERYILTIVVRNDFHTRLLSMKGGSTVKA